MEQDRGSVLLCLQLHHFSAMGPLAKFVVSVVESLSRLFVTSWTVTRQAPTSVGFPRQEYWSGLPFPSPGDLPDPGIEPVSPAWQADSLPLSHLGSQNCFDKIPNQKLLNRVAVFISVSASDEI